MEENIIKNNSTPVMKQYWEAKSKYPGSIMLSRMGDFYETFDEDAKITSKILKKNRLVVTVNENINELKEVIVTTEDVEKFLDLKEEEFKGFDYDTDKSSRLENKAVRDRVISNGIDFVNIAKLIAKAFSNKTVEEQLKMKPSEILPLVFDDRFFENDLDLPQDQVMGFLIFIDNNMKTSSLLKQDMQFRLIDYLINRSKEFKNGQVN